MNEPCRIIKKIDNCPGYQKCNGFEWYDWGDIRWCSHQVWWILKNAADLQIGGWPDPPQYLMTDMVQKGILTDAYYVKAAKTLAGVRERLSRTGKDGKWLVSMIILDCPVSELPNDPRDAFHYITGWRRKHTEYTVWKAKRIYRKGYKNIPKGRDLTND